MFVFGSGKDVESGYLFVWCFIFLFRLPDSTTAVDFVLRPVRTSHVLPKGVTYVLPRRHEPRRGQPPEL